MTTLKSSDGEEFDLSGSFRKECRKDGWYVIGENMLIPVGMSKKQNEYIYNIFNHHPVKIRDNSSEYSVRQDRF